MRNRNNKIIHNDGLVLTVDVSTDTNPCTTTKICKEDWIRIKLYEDVGRFSAFRCGRQVYAKANIPGGGFVFLHHLVWGKKEMLDHINRDGLDNRKSNLRKCDKSQNGININPKSNNTSGVTGVWWHKEIKRWRAEIKVDGKKKCLGSFMNKNEAIAIRKMAEEEYFGEFA